MLDIARSPPPDLSPLLHRGYIYQYNFETHHNILKNFYSKFCQLSTIIFSTISQNSLSNKYVYYAGECTTLYSKREFPLWYVEMKKEKKTTQHVALKLSPRVYNNFGKQNFYFNSLLNKEPSYHYYSEQMYL